MSALPPKADMCSAIRDVRFVPKADIRQRISREGLDLGPTYAELLLRIHTLVRVTFTRLIWINGQPPSRRQYSFLETSLGRETMSKRRMLIAFLAVTLAAPLGFVDTASAAKKKVTYEEAWKLCKAELDKSGAYGTGTQANERHTRGAGCMQKYGYKI